MFVPAREDHVGRIAGILLIDLVEILVIGKTHQLRDLVELVLAALLQLHGAPNAAVIEKIVEKVQKSDLATINKMIDELLPTIKTSLSAAEILSYAKSFTEYKLSESSGFPFAKTTDTISGLGSVVIPVTLEDNVLELHKFLYTDVEEAGEEEENYQPSEDVMRVNDKIVSLVGPRTPMFEEKKEDEEDQTEEVEAEAPQMKFEVIE